jgi:hypothetical protein
VQLPIVGRAAAVVGADDGAALGFAVALAVGDGAAEAEGTADGDAVGVDVCPGLGDTLGATDGPGFNGTPPPPEHPASTATTSTIGDFRIPWVRRGRRTF